MKILVSRFFCQPRDSVHAEGVIARKNEKIRIKHVKDLAKQGVSISGEMLNPIDDPEAIWKASDITWQTEETKKKTTKGVKDTHIFNDEEEETKTIFIMDTVGDQNLRFIGEGDSIRLQKDFVAFEIEEEVGDDGEDSDEDDVQEQLGYY